MRSFTLALFMLGFSFMAGAQSCPQVLSSTINANGPGNYTVAINYTSGPGAHHFNVVTFCSSNPFWSLVRFSCISVSGNGTAVFNVSCSTNPIVILVPVNGACGSGLPCGLPIMVSGPAGGPLPIKMNEFYAQRNNAQVVLSWRSEVEINAYEYVVERKTTGDFIPVGTVQATNNTEGSKYSFTDLNAETGVSQYRIKMTDADGTFRYSEIKSVRGYNNKQTFTLFPNPATAHTDIYITDLSANTEVQIIDPTGRMVKRITSTGNTNINVGNLPRGLYMVRLIDRETGETVTKKLSVTN